MKISNRQIIIDLDNTITINDYSKEYQNKDVNKAVVETMRKIKSDEITILTARNMKTYAGDIEKINNFTKPIAVKWLRDNKIEYNNIIFGKPWCKEEGHYVDDKNISIEEFIFKFNGPYSEYSVDIVIPFFNEKENIIKSYYEHKRLERLFNIKQYIFVDNGSEKSSEAYFEKVKNIEKKLKVIKINNNIGYGFGMKKGIESSDADLVITNHADCQFDAYTFFYQHMNDFNKNGFKSIFPKRINRPFFDNLNSSILRFLMSCISFKKVKDFNGQPKLLHKRDLVKIESFPNDFTLDYVIWKECKNVEYFPILQKPRLFGESSWSNQIFKRLNIFMNYLISALTK